MGKSAQYKGHRLQAMQAQGSSVAGTSGIRLSQHQGCKSFPKYRQFLEEEEGPHSRGCLSPKSRAYNSQPG